MPSGLMGELSTRSKIFRTWWSAHNVRFHAVKRLCHPAVVTSCHSPPLRLSALPWAWLGAVSPT